MSGANEVVFAGNDETGILMSEQDWLRLHFEACRSGHEEQVRGARLQHGWSVLDAGCGPGHYLPLLGEQVGPQGQITAIDKAQSLLDAAADEYGEGRCGCATRFERADVLELPYADASFDAVWCTNVSQYLSDDELTAMVAEFARVTRPGGVVALKEWDFTLWRMQPAEPAMLWRIAEAWSRSYVDREEPLPHSVQGYGCMRAPRLSRWLESAGLRGVRHESALVNHCAPLPPSKRAWLVRMLQMFAGLSEELEVDQSFWGRFNQPDDPQCLLNDPSFFMTEGSTLAVGTLG